MLLWIIDGATQTDIIIDEVFAYQLGLYCTLIRVVVKMCLIMDASSTLRPIKEFTVRVYRYDV